jgi:hypothetical protein
MHFINLLTTSTYVTLTRDLLPNVIYLKQPSFSTVSSIRTHVGISNT